jgi:hypothetical protein
MRWDFVFSFHTIPIPLIVVGWEKVELGSLLCKKFTKSFITNNLIVANKKNFFFFFDYILFLKTKNKKIKLIFKIFQKKKIKILLK